MTSDTTHVTGDRWHMSRDMWHATCFGGENSVKILASQLLLWFVIFDILKVLKVLKVY